MSPWAGLCRRFFLTIVLFSAVLVGACASHDPNVIRMEETVTPITVGEAGAVSALELAEAMLRAGFSREEILEHGPAIRNALATSGGAQVRRGRFVAALFSIADGKLFVSSLSRGTFVQPLASP